MRNFLKISEGLNVSQILTALQLQPDLWDENVLRTEHPESPHQEASDIWLWFNKVESAETVIDDIQTHPFSAWFKLPEVHSVIFDLMRFTQATQLGRCIISRLAPGKRIEPHIDQGAPATFYQRFQICLQSSPGCVFRIEDEQVMFKPGEIWLINNNAEHEVINNSKDDRICIVCDLRIPKQ